MRIVQVGLFLIGAVLLLGQPQVGPVDRRVAPVAAAAPAMPSDGARRMALVIGNGAYTAGALRNPVHDAQDFGKALVDLGFDTTVLTDLDGLRLDRGVRDFAARVQPGDVTVFYYSGHGLQVGGQNYLVPVNFSAGVEADVPYQAYAANRVRDLLHTRGARLSILILDACRNNPFQGLRAIGGGLAGMSGEGTFVAFAADEGRAASDNPGERNGLFTKYLLQEIRLPGHIEDVFRRVRADVLQASGGTQHPFTSSGIVGEFYFTAKTEPAGPKSDAETEFWKAAREINLAAAYEQYLQKYPNGEYALLARLKVEQLRQPGAVPAAGPVKPVQTGEPEAGGRDFSWIHDHGGKKGPHGRLHVGPNLITWNENPTIKGADTSHNFKAICSEMTWKVDHTYGYVHQTMDLFIKGKQVRFFSGGDTEWVEPFKAAVAEYCKY
jgi:hypothetical protein